VIDPVGPVTVNGWNVMSGADISGRGSYPGAVGSYIALICEGISSYKSRATPPKRSLRIPISKYLFSYYNSSS
jgi:hypothetical protein